MTIRAECGHYIDDNCKCPVNPKAKTAAQEIAEEIMRRRRWLFIDGGEELLGEITDALQSYADSVAEEKYKAREAVWKSNIDLAIELERNRAEERVKEAYLKGLQAHPCCCEASEDCDHEDLGYDKGFRAGQIRMRERAVDIVASRCPFYNGKEHRCTHCKDAEEIRSLEVEEK